MSIAPYIKEIGRGKDGARSLTQTQAYDLMSQVLDGRVTDLEIGAFALAMRIKGETTEELAGFLEATNERCMPVRPAQPAVLPGHRLAGFRRETHVAGRAGRRHPGDRRSEPAEREGE